MELLQAGVDRALIALWLGHESVETTQIYLDADLQSPPSAFEMLRADANGQTHERSHHRDAP